MTTAAVHHQTRCPELITLNTNVLQSAQTERQTRVRQKNIHVSTRSTLSLIFIDVSPNVFMDLKKEKKITKVLSTCRLSRRSGVQLPMSVHVQIVSGYR